MHRALALALALLLLGCTKPEVPQNTTQANTSVPLSCVAKGFILPAGRSCCPGLTPSTPYGGELARCCGPGEVASLTGCVAASQAQPPGACTNTCPDGSTPSNYPACTCPQPTTCGREREACASDADCCAGLHCAVNTEAGLSACCAAGGCITAGGCVTNGTLIANDTANALLVVCEDGTIKSKPYACGRENASCDSQPCCGSLVCRSYLVEGGMWGSTYTLKKCCGPADCLGPVGGGLYGCIPNASVVLNNLCDNGVLEHIPLRVTNITLSVTEACELVVYIYYNLELDASSARNANNYAVSGGLNVTSTGNIGRNGVFLRIAGDWATATNYTITINNVRDSTNFEIRPNTQAVFTTPLFKRC
ncbi:MAG: Ig-like domain-containing protein [Candidatus Micrarchaeia archaeon]